MERTNSVKSTDHVIEILIPSEATSDDYANDAHSPGAAASRRQSTLSEGDDRSHEDALLAAPAEETAADDARPKIILHLPKKKSKNMPAGARAPAADQSCSTPLSRLPADELRVLSQLSEKDLKDSLLKALDEKNPT